MAVIPFPSRRINNDPAAVFPILGMPRHKLAQALSEAFVDGRYSELKAAFDATDGPLAAAALAITIMDYLTTEEIENFSAFIRHSAK